MDWMEVSRTLSRGLEDSLIKELYYKFILKSKPLKILKINKINMTYYRSRGGGRTSWIGSRQIWQDEKRVHNQIIDFTSFSSQDG